MLVPSQAATRADASPGAERVEALNRAYVDALQAAGVIPVLLPTESRLPDDLSWASGLLLPGGPDVEPRRYGQEPGPATRPEPISDQLEFALAEWALRSRVPLLAICRGLQVLNVALGGSLVQDLPDHAPHPGGQDPPRRDRPAHRLAVASDSLLGRIVGVDSIQVNSLHHQGIDRLAPDLLATAWAPDGLIEGVELRSESFGLGVQYHPEELAPHDRAARALFEAFAKACRDGVRDRGEVGQPARTGSGSASGIPSGSG